MDFAQLGTVVYLGVHSFMFLCVDCWQINNRKKDYIFHSSLHSTTYLEFDDKKTTTMEETGDGKLMNRSVMLVQLSVNQIYVN